MRLVTALSQSLCSLIIHLQDTEPCNAHSVDLENFLISKLCFRLHAASYIRSRARASGECDPPQYWTNYVILTIEYLVAYACRTALL